MALVTTWRGGFSDREVDELEAVATGRPRRIVEQSWNRSFDTHALGWVCVRDEDDALVGIAHVAPPRTPGVTDLLLPLVHPRLDRDTLAAAMAAAISRETGLTVRRSGS